MPQPVIETSGLTKDYGAVRAVDDLHLRIPAGTVFGLLGPNGAGKTTIIGILLGLIRPTRGTVRLFGSDTTGSTDAAVRRIGAIMETPAFYPFLSGRNNLRYFQGISGAADEDEIDRLLEVVGLAGRGDDAFSTYSLGMKHRLGIAYALLGDPELLLLDEPTNGLDPAGMAEVRQLLRRLGNGERTIVLASHLLNEVEQVCEQVAILSHGRVVAQGAVREIIGRRTRFRLATTDDAAAHGVLDAVAWIDSVVAEADGLLVEAPEDRAADLSRALVAAGIYPTRLVETTTSLEQYFLEVTGEEGS